MSALARSGVVVVAAFLACAAGCSSKEAAQGDAPTTCSFSQPIPTAPSSSDANAGYVSDVVPQGMSVDEYVTAQALVALDTLIGSYLRGDNVVYTGTLAAHDDQSVLGVDCPGDSGLTIACQNRTIESGPAVASLTTSQGVSTLTVHSISQHEYVAFQQGGGDAGVPAGVTAVGIVLPDNNSGGNSGTCTHCAPSFAGVPQSIVIDNLVSNDEVPNPDATAPDGAPTDAKPEAFLHTYASANLTLATPCQLTWADLVELNALSSAAAPSLGSFSLQGGEMVAVETGSIYTENDGGDYCNTSFSLELFVNADDLAYYGVRNFQIVQPDASDDYGCSF